ncbi:hypothetical protein D9M71_620940 [compost metagenome]
MNILQTIGLKLLGQQALAAIKGEVVDLTRISVAQENKAKSFAERTTSNEREDYIQAEISHPGRLRQVQAALLVQLVGCQERAFEVTKAADVAEASGEGFMKKKAAVLKVVKEFGLSKSVSQLVIELAVQLSKD